MKRKTKNDRKSQEFDQHELDELVDKVNKEDPDEKDLEALREFLNQHPGAYIHAINLAKFVHQKIINQIFEMPAIQICIEANTDQFRDEMGYKNAPIQERLLIENLINCWLRLQWVEISYSMYIDEIGVYGNEVSDWEKRLTSTQRRYLRSHEAYIRYIRYQAMKPAL